MSFPEGIICIDYNISQDNPNKIYFKRDFEAFTKNPMISSKKENNIEGAVQLALSEKRNYTFSDLLENQIGKKRNSDNKFITFQIEQSEKNCEEASNYKCFSQTEDKEDKIEKVIIELSFSLNRSELSHTEKKIQAKNRSVLIKRILSYYKKIMTDEEKREIFLNKMEEYFKQSQEDIKVKYKFNFKKIDMVGIGDEIRKN